MTADILEDTLDHSQWTIASLEINMARNVVTQDAWLSTYHTHDGELATNQQLVFLNDETICTAAFVVIYSARDYLRFIYNTMVCKITEQSDLRVHE